MHAYILFILDMPSRRLVRVGIFSEATPTMSLRRVPLVHATFVGENFHEAYGKALEALVAMDKIWAIRNLVTEHIREDMRALR